MPDIELVIKIPEESYNYWKKHKYEYVLSEAIADGIVLPKGHGSLKDVTNLMRGLYTDTQTTEETFTSSEVYKMIDEECPTIIEADKESEE